MGETKFIVRFPKMGMEIHFFISFNFVNENTKKKVFSSHKQPKGFSNLGDAQNEGGGVCPPSIANTIESVMLNRIQITREIVS